MVIKVVRVRQERKNQSTETKGMREGGRGEGQEARRDMKEKRREEKKRKERRREEEEEEKKSD